MLHNSRYCGSLSSQIPRLNNGAASRSAIPATLIAFAQYTTAADTMLRFFSSYGEYSTDDTYRLTIQHACLDLAGKVMPGTNFSQVDPVTALHDLPAQQLLVLGLACHASAYSPNLGASAAGCRTNIAAADSTALLATESGRLIMTVCRK
ncbi:hypothetical protein [Chloroflexus sp.]|uniref:hypothetical protein n=1 Tax=Chloroflexus sp. TaxID=1904827 RepID=UPI002ADDBCB9|nr:hypothetical protein [Chloroflexus sp.]